MYDVWCLFYIQVPEVFPAVVNTSQSSAKDVYTISCVAHFAYPPVNLVWVKGQTLSVDVLWIRCAKNRKKLLYDCGP